MGKSVVLQTFNPQIGRIEVCHERNLMPKTVYGSKEKFLTGRRGSLEGPDAPKHTPYGHPRSPLNASRDPATVCTSDIW